ncbi:hypothetical protein TNIN_493021 [Trichonephila inaurata madagascariensis]|uniref:Uncharacterized protein n=1 Tax=Trichonephila inaurata madagascariensis TaxID=2747483 RepID=A0A8X6IXA9_9ARAC|nr:hypothetical protein TNIN_493021 [Trichonephila inaurata madagascariensis]
MEPLKSAKSAFVGSRRIAGGLSLSVCKGTTPPRPDARSLKALTETVRPSDLRNAQRPVSRPFKRGRPFSCESSKVMRFLKFLDLLRSREQSGAVEACWADNSEVRG